MIPGEGHWVEYPPANGREQSGGRPAVVLQDDAVAAASPMVLVVPLSTAPSVIRFPGVVFVAADADNGLTQDSYALVFQLRAIDRRRLCGAAGVVRAEVLAAIL